jgi:hypothetical protein
MAPHFDINVIAVGVDKFTTAQRQQVNDSIAIMTSIFAPLGPTVGTVNRHSINSANSRGLHIIRDFADVQSLPELWAVPNDAVDLFVVASIPLKDGWSPRPGKCPKLIDKNLRSPVVSLSGDKFNSGNTFAHEVGHFLGLPHAEDDTSLVGSGFVAANFMKAQSGSNTEMTQAQSQKLRTHCSIKF